MSLFKALLGKGVTLTRSIALRVPRAFPRVLRGRVVAETDKTKWRPNMAEIQGPPENED